MTFFIHTFGCQMNVNDSEKMSSILQRAGLQPAARAEEAAVVIVNSCAVRAKARDKVFSYIGRLRREQIVIVAGCVAQAERDSLLRRRGGIDFLVGTHQFHRLDQIVRDLLAERRQGSALGFFREWAETVPEAAARTSTVTASISVMEGCDNFCSYCIVPFTRGREKHRAARHILAEAHDLARRGYREIVLLGQNVNHWRDPEGGGPFPLLLERLAREVDVDWIRFITSYPGYHDPQLVRVVAENPRIARHIHFPAQSGSTRVLRRMQRRYTRGEYLRMVDQYRRQVPGMQFSSDFIVGFPGESDRDFELTLSLVQRVEYVSLFSFAYSPRPLTRAGRWPDDVSREVKSQRLQRLQQVQADIQLRRNRQMVGREVGVLVMAPHPTAAGEVLARTESYRVVNLESTASPGSRVRARITRAGPHSLRGREVHSP